MFTCLCGAEWTGPERVHCPACHETFDCADVAARHRPDDECRRPTAAGLVLVGGVWHDASRAQWQSTDTN